MNRDTRTRRIPGALPALALLALLASPGPARNAGAAKFDARAALALGHEMAAHLVNERPGPLWARLGPRMREAYRDSAGLASVLALMRAGAGRADSVLEEGVREERGSFVYRAVTRFTGARGPLVVSVEFDRRGRIAGLFVKPSETAAKAYDSPRVDYVPRTPLRLPVRGEWAVAWGGRGIEQNRHASSRDQRFAIDLVIVRDGRSHAGDGSELGHYHCYGEPVLAPAAGRVVWLRDSLPDNRIGRTDTMNPAGNAVLLDHGRREYSLLAHLQPRTLRFKLDDWVRAGEVIGLAGNSGNSGEPHLHFHLQDSPRFGDADGLPPVFMDLFVDGVHADTAEIVKGQKVRPSK